jgi:hypothetical protein
MTQCFFGFTNLNVLRFFKPNLSTDVQTAHEIWIRAAKFLLDDLQRKKKIKNMKRLY